MYVDSDDPPQKEKVLKWEDTVIVQDEVCSHHIHLIWIQSRKDTNVEGLEETKAKPVEAGAATMNHSVTISDSSGKVGKSEVSVPSAEPPVQNSAPAVSTAITDTVTAEESTTAANPSHDTNTTAPAGTSSVANMDDGNPGAENNKNEKTEDDSGKVIESPKAPRPLKRKRRGEDDSENDSSSSDSDDDDDDDEVPEEASHDQVMPEVPDEEDIAEMYGTLGNNFLTRRQTIFKDGKIFEHHEMKDKINFPNPPIRHWYTGAPADKRALRNYQMLALAWMESRINYGGGIIADEIGLGKVISLHVEHTYTTIVEDYLTSRPVKY